MVELEPEVSLCDFGYFFNTRGGNRAEDEGNILPTRGAGEDLAGLWPHQALEADGSDAKRRGVFVAEEGGFLGSAFVVAQVGGSELHGTDVTGIFVKVHLRHAATREVVVGKTRHALPGAFGKKFDRWIGGIHEWDRARRGLVMT